MLTGVLRPNRNIAKPCTKPNGQLRRLSTSTKDPKELLDSLINMSNDVDVASRSRKMNLYRKVGDPLKKPKFAFQQDRDTLAIRDKERKGLTEEEIIQMKLAERRTTIQARLEQFKESLFASSSQQLRNESRQAVEHVFEDRLQITRDWETEDTKDAKVAPVDLSELAIANPGLLADAFYETGGFKGDIRELFFWDIYPAQVRKWFVYTRTPKGYYDQEGIWQSIHQDYITPEDDDWNMTADRNVKHFISQVRQYKLIGDPTRPTTVRDKPIDSDIGIRIKARDTLQDVLDAHSEQIVYVNAETNPIAAKLAETEHEWPPAEALADQVPANPEAVLEGGNLAVNTKMEVNPEPFDGLLTIKSLLDTKHTSLLNHRKISPILALQMYRNLAELFGMMDEDYEPEETTEFVFGGDRDPGKYLYEDFNEWHTLYEQEKRLLPADLRDQFRFGIDRKNMIAIHPKLRRLFSFSNANPSEIEQFRLRRLVEKFGHHPADTGSPAVQIGLLTMKIERMANLFNTTSKKDAQGRRRLQEMLHTRTKLLRYLKRRDVERYYQILKETKLKDAVDNFVIGW